MTARAILVVALTTLACSTTGSRQMKRCSEMALPSLPDVRIVSVSVETDGAPHCKVTGVIGTETNFELLLPEKWNGKFVMGGGGGFVGRVVNTAMAFAPLQNGYATVGTDTGHRGSPLDASWALNNLERVVSFGHQAVHRTAVTAKGAHCEPLRSEHRAKPLLRLLARRWTSAHGGTALPRGLRRHRRWRPGLQLDRASWEAATPGSTRRCTRTRVTSRSPRVTPEALETHRQSRHGAMRSSRWTRGRRSQQSPSVRFRRRRAHVAVPGRQAHA